MIEHQVLFCPFCGESFEGRATCPAHDLPLVPFDRASAADDLDGDGLDDALRDRDEDAIPLALLDPRRGRAPVALAALLLAASLPAGLARVGNQTLSTYEVAARFPSLWTWPLVSFCALYLLSRRRTPAALRSLRIVVPWLGMVALVTLALAAMRLGAAIAVAPAAYLVSGASALLVVAGVRLGALSKRA